MNAVAPVGRRRRQRAPAGTREPRARVSPGVGGGGASYILQRAAQNRSPSRGFGASCETAQRHAEVGR